jgi:hypothetical protein
MCRLITLRLLHLKEIENRCPGPELRGICFFISTLQVNTSLIETFRSKSKAK